MSPAASSVPAAAASWHRGLVERLKGVWIPLAVVGLTMLLEVAGLRLPLVECSETRFDPACCPAALLPRIKEINDVSPDGTPIFNDMNFGGFLIYHARRLRVFVDDRCLLYGSDFLLAYERARRNNPAKIDRWRKEYKFNYALVETSSPFDDYLQRTAEWTVVGRTPTATLYQHR
jgi:hypothetical protein